MIASTLKYKYPKYLLAYLPTQYVVIVTLHNDIYIYNVLKYLVQLRYNICNFKI